MILESIATILLTVAFIIYLIYLKFDKTKLKDNKYFQITFLLGSGGHTGQMCQLIKGLHFDKAHRINVLITQTDKSSENFFTKSLKSSFSNEQYCELQKKINIYYIKRTNEVKQSYLSALLSGIKALLNGLKVIVSHLNNTTHFISNGPGTCVPLFYIFFVMKILRISRVKLIFFESWCRVTDLSLSGKLVKPIADELIVHWPQLAQKYKKCKYYGKII